MDVATGDIAGGKICEDRNGSYIFCPAVKWEGGFFPTQSLSVKFPDPCKWQLFLYLFGGEMEEGMEWRGSVPFLNLGVYR